MANFGAMPFETGPDGKIVYGAPRRATSEIGARCLAAAMLATVRALSSSPMKARHPLRLSRTWSSLISMKLKQLRRRR